jgi:hypothetical protein
MTDEQQLPIPEAATDDPKSVEVLRVWVANGEQHVVIRIDAWKDPGAWGIVLADLAKHVSRALDPAAKDKGALALKRIHAMLNAEFGSPTDD